MKFFNLCLIFFVLFISCTTSDSDISTPLSQKDKSFSAERLFEGNPSNVLNPYDVAGRLHLELYYSYYEGNNLPHDLATISERVVSLANQNNLFTSLSSIPYSYVMEDRVAYVLANGSCCHQEIIATTVESEEASNHLSYIISTVLPYCESAEDYASIYSFVTTFEESILLSKNLTSSDKQIILTTTSIIRYATYERKRKPKKNTDPEWDLMIGNIVGSIEGGSYSIEDAVVMSLVCGIVENGI